MITFQNPDNGNIYIVHSSKNEKIQEKHATLGQVPIGGWIIKPKSNGTCHCSFIGEIDFGGSVPKEFVRKAMRQQGNGLKQVREAIKDF